METSDPAALQHFVDAQAPLLDAVERELQAGRKTSHSMWFIFPPLLGLGTGSMAWQYAIRSLGEARSHFTHPVLTILSEPDARRPIHDPRVWL